MQLQINKHFKIIKTASVLAILLPHTLTLALTRFIDEVKTWNRQAIIFYVDFKKVFWFINRGKTLKIMKSFNVHVNFLNTIILPYENTKSRIITQDGKTELFETTAGTLKRDTFDSYLFVLYATIVFAKRWIEQGKSLVGWRVEPKILTI